MIEFLFVCIVVCTIQSCNQGSFIEDLSGGYSYHDAGKNYKDIIGEKKRSIPFTKKSNLKYIKERNIYSTVIDYSFDEQFVLAIQKPNKRGHAIGIKFELEDVYSVDESESIADSLISCDSYYQEIFSRELNYWIISHKDDSLFGPYSKEEYLLKRKELGVPEELRLRRINLK